MWKALLFIFISTQLNAQSNSVKTILSWFDKSSVDSISKQLNELNYQLTESKDSINTYVRSFVQKATNTPDHKLKFSANDTSLTFFSWDVYGHNEQRSITSQLRSLRFKQLEARLDGNYITTTFDNGIFLVEQRYQAVDNLESNGQVPLFQHRIYRKYGLYDKLNGVKDWYLTDLNGKSYLAGKETYQNGVLNGPRTLFYSSGKIRLEENYTNGRLSGKQNEYDESGLLIHTATYSYNWHYGPEKWFNNKGEIIRSVNWQRDIKTGQEIEKKDGKTVRMITYKKGIPNGKALLPIYSILQDSLNDIPEMLEDLNFVNGQKNGKFYRYLTTTKDTVISGNYVNNNFHGTVRTYNKQKLLFAITYADGLKHGAELVYENATNYSGNVLCKKYFKNGFQDSVELLLVTNGEHAGDTAKITFIKNGKYYGQEIGKYYPNYNRNNELTWKPYTYLCNYDSIQMKRTFSTVFADSLSIQGHYYKGFRDSVWIRTVKLKGKITTTQMTYKLDVLNGPFEKKINTNYVESGIYAAGLKEGKWTKSGDSLTLDNKISSDQIIEHYRNDKLYGLRQYYQNQLLIRQDSLVSNTLVSTMITNPKGFIAYVFDSINFDRGKAYFTVTERQLDTMICYPLALLLADENQNYLSDWYSWIETNSSEICGDVKFETSEFKAFTTKERTLQHANLIIYKSNQIHQFKSGNEEIWHFELNKIPYTGELISTFDNCHYVIKDGLLNGWTTYFNEKGIPVKRVKFKKSQLKKISVLR